MYKAGYVLLVSGLAFAGTVPADETAPIVPVPAAPNGMEFPADYPDWRVISVSHRTDNKSMRAILGNDIAVEAARAGNTNPWPDGAALGKVVWNQVSKAQWETAIVPRKFTHVEFMFRDSQKWEKNGTGWGWARWIGNPPEPYGEDADISQECISCHTPVKDNDWVFTRPARFPTVFRQ